MPKTFISNLNKSGISKPNLFEVHIESFAIDSLPNRSPSEGITNVQEAYGVKNDLVVRCEATSLPSRTLMTTTHRIYGPTTEQPYGELFQELSLNFILDHDLNVRRYFDTWMENIVTAGGGVKYQNRYVKSIDIGHLSADGQYCVYAVRYFRCFPKTLNEVAVSYNATGEFLKQNISFSYHKWLEFDPNDFQVVHKNIISEVQEKPKTNYLDKAVRYGLASALRKNVDNRFIREQGGNILGN